MGVYLNKFGLDDFFKELAKRLTKFAQTKRKAVVLHHNSAYVIRYHHNQKGSQFGLKKLFICLFLFFFTDLYRGHAKHDDKTDLTINICLNDSPFTGTFACLFFLLLFN